MEIIEPRKKCRRVPHQSVAACLPKLAERGVLWNDSMDPWTITKGSHKKVKWKCATCEHSWYTMIKSVTSKGSGCPFCAGQKLCVDIDCEMCFNRSVASCSTDFAERGILWDDPRNPRTIAKGSDKKAGWKCEKCNHSWYAVIQSVTSIEIGCPFCAGKKLCVDIDCEMCFNRSVASCSTDFAERGILWDDPRNPRTIAKGSQKKVGLRCARCDHLWMTVVKNVTSNGGGCPFCAGKKLCIDIDCEMCFNRSVASKLDQLTERGVLWNGLVDPRTIAKGSGKKAGWKCARCAHLWYAMVKNVTSNRCGCPKCVNKTQALVHDFVTELLPDVDVHAEWSPDWLGRKRFDIAIPSLRLIIEVDGDQHYVQVSNWAPPHITQANDRWKEERAAENGFTVFRIRTKFIWAKESKWKHRLTELVDKHDETPMERYLEDSE